MTFQFNYVHKNDGNGNKSINLALPYEAYTVATNAVDPGPDNRAGTADDATIQVFSVPRTYPTFGQNIERIVQAEGRNRYHAMGFTLNRQFSNRYSFLVSLDSDYRDLRDNAPRNPNEALYGPGTTTGNNYGVQNFAFARPSWNYAMRMSGSVQLKWGFLYASSFTAQSGDYFFREVQVRDAQQHQCHDPRQSAGGPLRLDEDLGQPHHQAVRDLGQPVDRGSVRSLQHAERQYGDEPEQP